jgi:NAD+ synthase (glutamine-hydrolysing)
MVQAASGMSYGAYIYVSCGVGESSNDVVFGGHAIIAENGTILKESQRFVRENQVIVQDIDIDRISHERRLIETFGDAAALLGIKAFRNIDFILEDTRSSDTERFVDAHPFVPSNEDLRGERCKEVFSIQVAGFARKLKGAKTDRVVLGVSGGLDSTLAGLVLAKTMDYLGLPRGNASVFTMPGFGTTKRTKNNALRLARSLGLTVSTVDIKKSAIQHLKDLNRDPQEDDVTSQNVQARYRTEFLFNEANDPRAIVLGTGDLTEIALGWCTFSGDHMSHYHVNASVPKTLVKYLVRWVAETQVDAKAKNTLFDILDTPISPELTRSKSGKVEQKSEDYVGPFELADFYLYHFIRTGAPPSKILSLAYIANERGLFDARYTLEELKRWLVSFISRFFANQFKRTCMPEGPKVGSVSLSPRGDWRMPSDANPNVWLEDLERGYIRLSQGGIKK